MKWKCDISKREKSHSVLQQMCLNKRNSLKWTNEKRIDAQTCFLRSPLVFLYEENIYEILSNKSTGLRNEWFINAISTDSTSI